jgi:hypothetical protein
MGLRRRVLVMVRTSFRAKRTLPMPDATSASVELTLDQFSATLLELTGDLDKADVLQQRIAPWLLKAKPELLEQLEKVHELAGLHEPKVQAVLHRIKSLDTFCADELTRGLKRRFGVTLDVRRDYLHLPWVWFDPEPSPIIRHKPKVVLETRLLLQAAMQNFSENEAQGGHFPRDSSVHHGNTGAVVPEISVPAFATFCRELDLGRRYQAHLQASLNQALPLADEWLHNPDASEMKQLKVYDMAADVYLAYVRGDIGEPAFKLLLGLTRQGANVRKSSVDSLTLNEQPLLCHGLDVHDCCLWGVVVFALKAIDEHPETRCIVYMPGEPYRPIFEYPTFAEFQLYLTLKLRVKSYAGFFGRYLDESSRTDFFSRIVSVLFQQHGGQAAKRQPGAGGAHGGFRSGAA